MRVNVTDFAIHGGEDYELLFTVEPGKERVFEHSSFKVTKIGQIIEDDENGTVIDSDGILLKDKGFQHF